MGFSQSTHLPVLGDVNVHRKDWQTFSGGTDRPVCSDITFLSQTTILRWLTFPARILDRDFHSPAFLDLFISSDHSISSTVFSLPLGISDHVLASGYSHFNGQNCIAEALIYETHNFPDILLYHLVVRNSF